MRRLTAPMLRALEGIAIAACAETTSDGWVSEYALPTYHRADTRDALVRRGLVYEHLDVDESELSYRLTDAGRRVLAESRELRGRWADVGLDIESDPRIRSLYRWRVIDAVTREPVSGYLRVDEACAYADRMAADMRADMRRVAA